MSGEAWWIQVRGYLWFAAEEFADQLESGDEDAAPVREVLDHLGAPDRLLVDHDEVIRLLRHLAPAYRIACWYAAGDTGPEAAAAQLREQGYGAHPGRPAAGQLPERGGDLVHDQQ